MKLEFTWDEYEVPEYDPEKHNPEKVFAMLCYRGIHYAKWVVLDPFKIKTWKIKWDQAFLFVKQMTDQV